MDAEAFGSWLNYNLGVSTVVEEVHHAVLEIHLQERIFDCYGLCTRIDLA